MQEGTTIERAYYIFYKRRVIVVLGSFSLSFYLFSLLFLFWILGLVFLVFFFLVFFRILLFLQKFFPNLCFLWPFSTVLDLFLRGDTGKQGTLLSLAFFDFLKDFEIVLPRSFFLVFFSSRLKFFLVLRPFIGLFLPSVLLQVWNLGKKSSDRLVSPSIFSFFLFNFLFCNFLVRLISFVLQRSIALGRFRALRRR